MIAILEDDKSIRDIVLYTLKSSGFEAVGYAISSDFYEGLKTDTPELLLLDIMLPQEDGLEVLAKLREKEETKKMPIIMLTAKDTEYDKIVGLDGGADDYVTKPFSMLELVSRIKALLRRTKSGDNHNVIVFQKLKLNDESHKVTLCDKTIETTLKEYELLKILLQNQGKVVKRNELLHSVWGWDFAGETRTLDVHIRMLRTKLGEYEHYIETVRGVGYRIGENND